MTYEHPAQSVAHAVSVAVLQCDAMAPGSRVADCLSLHAPDAAFWIEAAAELHRRSRHFDALDCWNMGLQVDPESVDRQDMARTLWAISEGDDIFAQEALRQFEHARAWQFVAFLRFKLQRGEELVFAAIEAALEVGDELAWEDFWAFGYPEVCSWYDLGLHYFEREQKSKAVAAFGKALLRDPDDRALATYIGRAISEHIKVDLYGREI